MSRTLRRTTTAHAANIDGAMLDSLMMTLDVQFVGLAECHVGAGFALHFCEIGLPSIHYSIEGTARVHCRDAVVLDFAPHTLVVVPPNCPFRIEVPSADSATAVVKTIDDRTQMSEDAPVQRFSACDQDAGVVLIRGAFSASYGASTDLFGALAAPIIERFTVADEIHDQLQSALKELAAQEIGARAVSAALLKQVIVALVRRSVSSTQVWMERFAILRDEQIARALSKMTASPGEAHTIHTLAKTAGLSRSAFMARFVEVVGRPPMIVLRELRMRHAANSLKARDLSIDQIANNVGYGSRSSFIRAFRRTYGCDPSRYRSSH